MIFYYFRYCGKSFKHAKSLRRHENTHVSDSKFACDQCDSKFSRKDNLERHKMCHVETALHCSICKKKFSDLNLLFDHEQNHIKARRFQCQICKDKFLEETYFFNHMEKNHGISKEMVPMINNLAAESNEKPSKSKRSTDNNGQPVLVEALKIPTVSSQSFEVSSGVSPAIDTLNLSMSVAGILPTSGGQDLSTINLSGLQSVLNSQGMILNHNFSNNQGAATNPARNSLNQQTNDSFTATQTGTIIQAIPDMQRLTIINPSEPGTITLQRDQVPIGLVPSENVILHEQQRLMQEALGNNVQIQGAGFRLQNMY